MFLSDALKLSRIADSIYKPAGNLVQVNGFESEHAGQVIEGLDIWAFNNPIVLNHPVIMRDCRIRYAGGRALLVNEGGAGSRLLNMNIGYMGNPRDNTLFSVGESREAIVLTDAPDVELANIKFNGGTLPIYATNCLGLRLREIQAANIFGNGLVHLIECPEALLEHFSLVNDLQASYTTDLLSLYDSDGVIIRGGLLSGHNSPTGYVFNFELSSNVLVEDVDVLHSGNGNLLTNSFNPTFRNVRWRDGFINDVAGRGAPESPELFTFVYDDEDTQSGARFIRCKYYNMPAIVDDGDLPNEDLHNLVDIQEEDFTPTPALDHSWAWEDVLQGPFAIIMLTPDGGDTVAITESIPIDTKLADLFYETSYIADDAVFSIVRDPFNKFYLDGDELYNRGLFYYEQATSIPLTLRAENSMGKSFEQTFIIAVGEDVGEAPVNYAITLNGLAGSSEISTLDIIHNYVFGDVMLEAHEFLLDQLSVTINPLISLDSIEAQAFISLPSQPIVIEVEATISSLDVTIQHALKLSSLEASAYINATPLNYMPLNSLAAQFTVNVLGSMSSNAHVELASIEAETYCAVNYVELRSITASSEIASLELNP